MHCEILVIHKPSGEVRTCPYRVYDTNYLEIGIPFLLSEGNHSCSCYLAPLFCDDETLEVDCYPDDYKVVALVEAGQYPKVVIRGDKYDLSRLAD